MSITNIRYKKLLCVALIFLLISTLSAVARPVGAEAYYSSESFSELAITGGVMECDTGNATLYFENDTVHGNTTFASRNGQLIANSLVSCNGSSGSTGMTYSTTRLIYDLKENVGGKVEVSFSLDLTGCTNAMQNAHNGQTPEAMITLLNSSGEEEIDIVYEYNTLWLDEYGTDKHLFGNAHGSSTNDIKLVLDFTTGTVTATGTKGTTVFERRANLKNGVDLRSIVFNFNGNINPAYSSAYLVFKLDNIEVISEDENELYQAYEGFDAFSFTDGETSDSGNGTFTFVKDVKDAELPYKTFYKNGSNVMVSFLSSYAAATGVVTPSAAQMIYTLPEAVSGKVEFSMDVKFGTYLADCSWSDWLVAKDSRGNMVMDIDFAFNNLYMFSHPSEVENACMVEGCSASTHNATYMHPSNFVSDWRELKFVLDFDNGTLQFYRNGELALHPGTDHVYTMALLNDCKDLKSLTFNFKGTATAGTPTKEWRANIDSLSVKQLEASTKDEKLDSEFSLKDGTRDVHPDQPIRIAFSNPVDVSTLSRISLTDAGGETVATRFAVSYDGTDVAVIPEESLSPVTEYILTIPENAVKRAGNAQIAATPATVTFTTGKDDGWYREENFNSLTYPAHTGDVIESINGTSFEPGSKINLDEGAKQVNSTRGYLTQAEEFSNGAGLTLRKDGRIDMIEANNKIVTSDGETINYTGSLQTIYKINGMTSGRLKVSFDLEMPGMSTFYDNYFFGINNGLSTGTGGALWYLGYGSDKQLFVKSNNADSALDFDWTDINGNPVPSSCGRFDAGEYHFDIDANIDTGIASVTIIKDGLYVGRQTTEPAVMHETYQAISSLVFDINFREGIGNLTDIYNVSKNGVKQMHYILDNVCARGFDSPAVTLENSADVKTSDNITLHFVTPMTVEGVTGNVVIRDKNGEIVEFRGNLSADGYTYDLNPIEALPYTNSTYTVEVYETNDWEGASLGEQTLTFTTAPRGADIKNVSAAMRLTGQSEALSVLPAGKAVTATVVFKNLGEIASSDTVLCIGVYTAEGKLVKIFASECNIQLYESDTDVASVSASFVTPQDLGEGGYIQIFAYDEAMNPYGETVILGK